jgi:hypothetical protein
MEVMHSRLDKQFMKNLGYKRVDEPIKRTKEKVSMAMVNFPKLETDHT